MTTNKLEACAQKVAQIQEQLPLVTTLVYDDLAETTACSFKFVRADALRKWTVGRPLPKHQELEKELGSDCFVEKKIGFRYIVSKDGAFDDVLIVSHGWQKAGNADPNGEQAAEIIRHLMENPGINYVWFDYWCLPQGGRSPSEDKTFRQTLEHIYILFLGLKVLILLDKQYDGRFWTSYEAYLAMQRIGKEGLEPSTDMSRVTIRCYGAAAKAAEENKQALKTTWGTCTPDEAYAVLKQDDIKVTNMRDKDQQLVVLMNLKTKMPVMRRVLAAPEDRERQRKDEREDAELRDGKESLGKVVEDLTNTFVGWWCKSSQDQCQSD